MQPLRILAMANVPEDRNAGAAGAEYETFAALRALGHHVDAVWADGIGRSIRHGNLNLLLELPRRYERIVAQKLSAAPYDVVHVNQPHGYRAARLVQRRWPQTAFIHRSHGFEPRVEEVLKHWQSIYGGDSRAAWRRAGTVAFKRLLSRHSREIVRWADGHILCSTQDAEFLLDRFPIDPAKVAVLPQAAPDEFLTPPLAPMTGERLRTILYVGQFIFIKAPMIVAAAMNRIAEENREARFVWVAGGEHHHAIRALLSPAVLERIDLRAWVPQSELRTVYDEGGIFLFPSFFEGSGKVHIEALSRGLCVVASNVGGMRDMIEPRRSGILVEPGDAAAVAGAALALMADPDRARAMSAAAGRRARQFSWHRTAVETAEFYRARIEAKRS